MQTDLLRQMLEALQEDNLQAAIDGSIVVREHQGSHAVSWTAAGAEEQHFQAFVEPAGIDVEDPIALRGHVGEVTALQTAAGRELAQVLAQQAEQQPEDEATLQTMVQAAAVAPGQTAALQALAQLTGLVITKLEQQATANAAFQKFVLAQQQVAFDSRDMVHEVPLGWTAYEIGGGGAGTVGAGGGPGGDWIGF
jgi:hypothetical protein